MEVWKDVIGYEGLYAVSNLGRVKSLPRDIVHKDGRGGHYKGRILKGATTKGGYINYVLSKGNHQKHFLAHRLVAEAFLPNPQGFSEVNHKDENKNNNRVDNLEWCNRDYNNEYGTRRHRTSKLMNIYDAKTGMYLCSDYNKEIREWLHCDRSVLHKWAKNIRKPHNGYMFKYAVEDDIPTNELVYSVNELMEHEGK